MVIFGCYFSEVWVKEQVKPFPVGLHAYRPMFRVFSALWRWVMRICSQDCPSADCSMIKSFPSLVSFKQIEVMGVVISWLAQSELPRFVTTDPRRLSVGFSNSTEHLIQLSESIRAKSPHWSYWASGAKVVCVWRVKSPEVVFRKQWPLSRWNP